MSNCKLPLEDGEELELRSAGAFSPKPSGRWRIGEWIKTDRRILFLQGDNVTLRVCLGSIITMSWCEREYAFKKQKCLKIIFNDGDNKRLWFITPHIAQWEERLAGCLEGHLTEADIVQVARRLGHSAEKILWHLYRKGHATIGELTDLAAAGSHMDVLAIIRKEINRISREVIGGPVLVFKPEGRDQRGRKIAYSWWFAEDQIARDSPFCDIMDEGGFYRIIVESPPHTGISLTGNRLTLQDGRGFAHAVALPPGASTTIQNKSYCNGIWEISIPKRQAD